MRPLASCSRDKPRQAPIGNDARFFRGLSLCECDAKLARSIAFDDDGQAIQLPEPDQAGNHHRSDQAVANPRASPGSVWGSADEERLSIRRHPSVARPFDELLDPGPEIGGGEHADARMPHPRTMLTG